MPKGRRARQKAMYKWSSSGRSRPPFLTEAGRGAQVHQQEARTKNPLETRVSPVVEVNNRTSRLPPRQAQREWRTKKTPRPEHRGAKGPRSRITRRPARTVTWTTGGGQGLVKGRILLHAVMRRSNSVHSGVSSLERGGSSRGTSGGKKAESPFVDMILITSILVRYGECFDTRTGVG